MLDNFAFCFACSLKIIFKINIFVNFFLKFHPYQNAKNLELDQDKNIDRPDIGANGLPRFSAKYSRRVKGRPFHFLYFQ